MNSQGSRWLSILCCATACAVLLPHARAMNTAAAVRFQDPKKQDPPKEKGKSEADALLEAEREQLRMKDVAEWKTLKVKSLDEVLDVKKATQPLEVPAAVTEEEKKAVTDALNAAKEAGSGARRGRELRKLEKIGWPAMVFLINELREVDYKDTDASMWGQEINTTLSNITMGVNTGYVPPILGEPMDPRMAQYNAMTVKEWINAVKNQWPTREKFDEFIARRKAKKEAEMEGRELPPAKGKEAEKK